MYSKLSCGFSRNILTIDNVEKEVNRISEKLKGDVIGTFKRKGAIVGISGGIDSSVTLGLAVNALGAKNVIGIMLPEKDSSPESKDLALELAVKFNVQTIEENITQVLEGFGCYKRRDEAVARLFPEYNPSTYKMKIGINNSGLNQYLPPLFTLTIIDSNGTEKNKILPVKEYLQIENNLKGQLTKK